MAYPILYTPKLAAASFDIKKKKHLVFTKFE